MKKILQNPFIFNICWLLILALLTYFVFTYSTQIGLTENWKHIIIGLFYSALILLINEIVQFFRDKKEFGILQGKYEREDWFEKLEKSLRAEDLNDEQKKKFLESDKKIVDGTSYKNFLYGKGVGWNIEINYLYKGVYSGTVDYPEYWANKTKTTKVAITLSLNNDLTTGSGTYSYIERNDFGIYSFQISELDSNKIIIRYKNTLPSGIAEGYEIWRRINPR